jgi:hypothetical protein
MRSRHPILGALGVLLFALGVLVGLAMMGGAVWGDLEASLFQSARRGGSGLPGLRCPVILGTSEAGTVSAKLRNPLDRPVEFNVRTYISEGYVSLMREEKTRLPLEPGEKERLEWPVTPDDAAYGRLILARVRVLGQYPLPERQAACGILVLDTGLLSGGQVVALAVLASLLGMGAGAGLWIAVSRPVAGRRLEAVRAMGALAASVGVGLVVSLLGLWVVGVVMGAATVLLAGAILGHFLTRRSGVNV